MAVFTYNRPEHTQRVLTSLSECTRLSECQLHIFCDGARTPAQQPAVAASRQTAREWAPHLGAEVIERPANLGLARSIVAAVTELVQAHGRVIVVDDDLSLSPDFLDFMLQGLDRYAAADQVYQIAGFTFPIGAVPAADCYFLPLITTWGWATWERAWQRFEWDPAHPETVLADPEIRRRFDLDDSYPYARMLEDRLAGKNDSWGILWWYVVFCAGDQVLYPQQSLVGNNGFDGSGTHSGTSQTLQQSLNTDVSRVRLSQPLALPITIETDEQAWRLTKQYLQQQNPRQPSLPQRVWNRLKSWRQRPPA